MTINFALEYIPRRARELGWGDNYFLRLKEIRFQPVEVKTIEAYNQFIILTDVGYNLKIESEMGIIDWTDYSLPENLYEHSGLITLTNKWEGNNNIQYIQVIPKNIFNAGE